MDRHRSWSKLSRVLPILIVAGAAISVAASLSGAIDLRTADEIIIALLGILAVDSLTERMAVIERIEQRLNAIDPVRGLQGRESIRSPVEQASTANEICLLAIHGGSIVGPFLGFHRAMVERGGKYRIILADPNAASVRGHDRLVAIQDSAAAASSTLANLQRLAAIADPTQFDVRFFEGPFSFSLFAADIGTPHGQMTVEFNGPATTIDSRPHLYLETAVDSRWFEFYHQQFEATWSASSPFDLDKLDRTGD